MKISPTCKFNPPMEPKMKYTAYRYYDDSPNYHTALIYSTDPDIARRHAELYHEELLDELVRDYSIFSACEIVKVTSEREFNACLESSDVIIALDHEGYTLRPFSQIFTS